MNQAQQQKFIGIVENLERILDITPAKKTAKQAASSYADLSEFNNKIDEFSQLSAELPSLLQEMTQKMVQLFNNMRSIMEFSSKAKAPKNEQITQIQQILQQKFNYFKNLDRDKEFGNHAKALYEGSTCLMWTLSNQMPKMILDSAIESSEYNANKFKRDKNQAINTWYNSYLAGLKILQNYIKVNYATGLNYNVQNGTDDYSELVSALQNDTQIVGVAGGNQSAGQKQAPVEVNEEGYPSLDTVKEALMNFMDAADATNNEVIVRLSEYTLEIFKKMKLVVENSIKTVKPKDDEIKSIQQIFQKIIKDIDALRSNKDMKDYVAPIQEGVSCVYVELNFL